VTEHPKAEKVTVYKDAVGEYRWRARAGNNEMVADSGEGYVEHRDALAAAAILFPEAEIEDET
jgi:uncharacterized protein YegP (UPF0339 family)